jgi:hypothetical protein
MIWPLHTLVNFEEIIFKGITTEHDYYLTFQPLLKSLLVASKLVLPVSPSLSMIMAGTAAKFLTLEQQKMNIVPDRI